MGLKVTNNAYGTLNAGINSSATTIVLTAGQGDRFPSLGAGDYFYATLIDTSNNLEIVKVTARATDTMTIVRAQDGTTARAYSTNDRFELRPTAALFTETIDKADAAVRRNGDTMTGVLTLNAGARIGGNNLWYDDTGYTSWKQTNYQGTLYLNNGVDRLTIDASGRVRTPNQPSFHVIRAGSENDSFNSSPLIYSTVIENNGSHFNTSTGRFTAPVSGRYFFSAGSHQNPWNGGHTTRLLVAGTQISNAWNANNTGSSSSTQFISGIKYMNTGDTAEVTFYTTKNNYMAETYWYFNGFLIG